MQTLLQRGLLLACLIVPAAARSDDAAQLKIDNFTFGPAKLVVTKGTAVTWTNQDDIPHSIVLTALACGQRHSIPTRLSLISSIRPGRSPTCVACIRRCMARSS